MLNIFSELWRAQQNNKRIIPNLNFPDTFIVEKHGEIEWYFVSQATPSKILRKKPSNSTADAIANSLKSAFLSTSSNSNNNNHSQSDPFPCVTVSRVTSPAERCTTTTLSDSSSNIHRQPHATKASQNSITIEHLSLQQALNFLLTDKKQNIALPRESLFLQRFIRSESNELHNHFIRVIYNPHFLRIERRRNDFVWENLTAASHSNLPSAFDRYNCTISFEGPEEFTVIEKLNERTASTLKELTKAICAQLESIHEHERGKVKQISLIFKKTPESIYLLHCNEISFERELHIPNLWRMSFALPFTIPTHITSDVTALREHNTNPTTQGKSKRFPCSACGEVTNDLHAVVKNKVQRIRVKRGVRESFNGLLPIDKNTLDKGAYNHYSNVPVCVACYNVYVDIQKADQTLIKVESKSMNSIQSQACFTQNSDSISSQFQYNQRKRTSSLQGQQLQQQQHQQSLSSQQYEASLYDVNAQGLISFHDLSRKKVQLTSISRNSRSSSISLTTQTASRDHRSKSICSNSSNNPNSNNSNNYNYMKSECIPEDALSAAAALNYFQDNIEEEEDVMSQFANLTPQVQVKQLCDFKQFLEGSNSNSSNRIESSETSAMAPISSEPKRIITNRAAVIIRRRRCSSLKEQSSLPISTASTLNTQQPLKESVDVEYSYSQMHKGRRIQVRGSQTLLIQQHSQSRELIQQQRQQQQQQEQREIMRLYDNDTLSVQQDVTTMEYGPSAIEMDDSSNGNEGNENDRLTYSQILLRKIRSLEEEMLADENDEDNTIDNSGNQNENVFANKNRGQQSTVDSIAQRTRSSSVSLSVANSNTSRGGSVSGGFGSDTLNAIKLGAASTKMTTTTTTASTSMKVVGNNKQQQQLPPKPVNYVKKANNQQPIENNNVRIRMPRGAANLLMQQAQEILIHSPNHDPKMFMQREDSKVTVSTKENMFSSRSGDTRESADTKRLHSSDSSRFTQGNSERSLQSMKQFA